MNGYLGRSAFEDLQGKFRKIENTDMFVFAFDSRTACSTTRDSIDHRKLFESIQDDMLDQSYLDKNLFEDEKSSPGRIFFGIPDSIDMKLFESDIGLMVKGFVRRLPNEHNFSKDW